MNGWGLKNMAIVFLWNLGRLNPEEQSKVPLLKRECLVRKG
ncbi:hypothetical protein CEB3_c39850 [Peptococcaceae bacterium CEB3]|nr:hypothetical protein CEB3_c39850 [Peptococcaceae bacterium CEB3]